MSKINDILKTSLLFLLLISIAPSIFFNLKKQWIYHFEPHNKIGYININGELTNSSFYRKHLSMYFKDNSIKAILLNIESGVQPYLKEITILVFGVD